MSYVTVDSDNEEDLQETSPPLLLQVILSIVDFVRLMAPKVSSKALNIDNIEEDVRTAVSDWFYLLRRGFRLPIAHHYKIRSTFEEIHRYLPSKLQLYHVTLSNRDIKKFFRSKFDHGNVLIDNLIEEFEASSDNISEPVDLADILKHMTKFGIIMHYYDNQESCYSCGSSKCGQEYLSRKQCHEHMLTVWATYGLYQSTTDELRRPKTLVTLYTSSFTHNYILVLKTPPLNDLLIFDHSSTFASKRLPVVYVNRDGKQKITKISSGDDDGEQDDDGMEPLSDDEKDDANAQEAGQVIDDANEETVSISSLSHKSSDAASFSLLDDFASAELKSLSLFSSVTTSADSPTLKPRSSKSSGQNSPKPPLSSTLVSDASKEVETETDPLLVEALQQNSPKDTIHELGYIPINFWTIFLGFTVKACAFHRLCDNVSLMEKNPICYNEFDATGEYQLAKTTLRRLLRTGTKEAHNAQIYVFASSFEVSSSTHGQCIKAALSNVYDYILFAYAKVHFHRKLPRQNRRRGYW